METTTPLLTIYDSFVRPFVRESQLKNPILTNTDQVKENRLIIQTSFLIKTLPI